LVFTASSFKRFQQSDLNKINQLRVRKIGSLLKYAANSGRRVSFFRGNGANFTASKFFAFDLNKMACECP